MNFKTCLNSVVSDYHTVLHCLVLSKLQEVSKHDTHPLLLARRQAWGWSKGHGTGCEISGAMTRSFLQGRSMVILMKGQKYWSNLIKRKSVIPSTQNPPKMILFLVLHASCCNCSMSGPRVLQLISWYWLQLSAVGQLLQWGPDITCCRSTCSQCNVTAWTDPTVLQCCMYRPGSLGLQSDGWSSDYRAATPLRSTFSMFHTRLHLVRSFQYQHKSWI